MEYRQLGKSGMEVSVVGLGTMSIAPGAIHTEIEEGAARETVEAALEVGINFFDTAPGYGDGESERRLGRALKASGRARESYFVATKVNGATLKAEEIEADCQASLERLGMAYVDLLQVHWAKRVVPLAESVRAMEGLKKKGWVRAVGVCNTGPVDLADALAGGQVDSVQVIYNLLTRAAEFGVAEMARQAGAGLLCYSPLAQGLLTGKYRSVEAVPVGRSRTRHFHKSRPQSRHGEDGFESETFAAIEKIDEIAKRAGWTMSDLAVAWLAAQPGVACVLCGASTGEQVRSNARAIERPLSAEILRELSEATAVLKNCLGPNLDPWVGNANSRCR